MPTSKHCWQNKSERERKQVLATVKACGRHRYTWGGTAALLGISEGQLRSWKRDDPEGKIQTAYEAGSIETAEKIASRLEAKALDPEEDGNTPALLTMAKHYLRLGDKSTQTVVTPSDLASDDSPGSKRAAALAILGLSALDEQSEGESGDPENPTRE